MSATYNWVSQKGAFFPYVFRKGIVKEPENANIFWIFADCKGKKVAYGQTPNPSEMSEPQNVYYGSDMGKSSGKPQVASVNHSPYNKWKPLCLGKKVEGKEMGHENKKVLFTYYKDVMENQAKRK